MVGKLNLDLGTDYAFDIRRARAVAEGATTGGGGGTNDLSGPYQYEDTTWWLDEKLCTVWIDIDSDPEPDVGVPVETVLGSDNVSDGLKSQVRAIAGAAGCDV